jgi:hypothetical protein
MKILLGFRADILVAGRVILEIKAVPAFVTAHEAQLQTYLQTNDIPVDFLLNFDTATLKDGLWRFIACGILLLSGPRRPRPSSVLKSPGVSSGWCRTAC